MATVTSNATTVFVATKYGEPCVDGLRQLKAKWNPAIKSWSLPIALIDQVNALVMVTAGSTEEPKPAGEKLSVGVYDAIAGLLSKARASGLKWPKLRFVLKSGVECVLSLAGKTAKVPDSVNVVTKCGDVNDWHGRILQDDMVQLRSSAPEEVRNFVQLLSQTESVVRFAAEYGRNTGNCCFCTRELTDSASVKAGYGPVCAERFGLPWGN